MNEQGRASSAEGWFQLILEAIPGVAYVAAPGEAGAWLYVSPRLEQVLGYAPEDWISETVRWADLIHPDDRAEALTVETYWPQATDGVIVNEYRLRRADGEYRWIRDASTARQAAGAGEDGMWFGVLSDITDVRDAQESLRQSEALLRSVLETAHDAFVAIDDQGRVLEWNRRAESMFGRLRQDVLGKVLGDLILPPGRAHDPFDTPCSMLELRTLRADGSPFLTELTLWPSAAGDSRRFNAFIRDVTERRQLQDELHAMAFSDPLTGLANRTAFRERLDLALDGRGSSGGPLVVMFLDIDDFKGINDSLGHAAGDQVLKVIADRLRSCVRPGDLVSRISGDEFALLLPEVSTLTDALGVADRVGRSLRAPIMLEGRRSVVSASIGLASSTHTRPLFGEALLREADAAMYQAKRSGKNSCVVFEPDMHAAAFARLELQADLALAAEHEEFHLNFQPYFDLVDRRLTGFEALIRWTHPIRGVVSPVDFIPLAESTGLIHSIGDWVLREACREAATWQAAKAGDPAPTVNVNISALQIQEPGLVEGVLAALELGGLEANRLVLEITEGVVVRRSDDIVATLQRLRQLGVRVAIDDFGTGYSSLSYLQNLPVDILKIDKSFVDHLATDGDDSSVAKLIVQIGRTLHLHVVAEGVELAEQVDSLLSLGCDSAQGFYLGRPLSADAARALCDFADPLAVPLRHLPTTAA